MENNTYLLKVAVGPLSVNLKLYVFAMYSAFPLELLSLYTGSFILAPTVSLLVSTG